jgi:hypothetical protein
MTDVDLNGLDAADPLGYMAALGVLRVLSAGHPEARLRWSREGTWTAVISTSDEVAIVDEIWADLECWRTGNEAVDFALNAERKVQDLKQPPAEFRVLMQRLAADPAAAPYAAAYATGVAVDGGGQQSKPTSFHFTAGQQRFMDAILSLRAEVTRADLHEALYGPWIGRVGPKDPRWRAGSDRSRALLSFDPGKQSGPTVPGAAWLAFQALPLFPVVPVKLRAVTTGFTGRGRDERFTWPVWNVAITVAEAATLIGTAQLAEMPVAERRARGIQAVLTCTVARSPQGYGNFSAAQPV